MNLDRRLSRLEQSSFLGSQDQLDECEFLFMRVPKSYQANPQLEKSQALASKLGKHLICLDSAAAHSLPLWALMPLDRLSDELLEEQINKLETAASRHNPLNPKQEKTCMVSAIANRVNRLEQANGIPSEASEVVIENVLIGHTDPMELAIERHYQNGALIYDSFAELLNEISGKTRSL